MKKSVLIISTLFSLLTAGLFAEEFPEWYSEDVTVTEKEITRKNSNNEWVPFIDKTFSACANVKIGGNIMSLYDARDAGEKEATKKLDDYLKKHKETTALESKHELTCWKFDDSLANGGAYVQVQVNLSTEKPRVLQEVSNDNDEIKEMNEFPRILQYKDNRLTLVDNINFQSQESAEAHRVVLTDAGKGTLKSKEGFYYPDGTLVYDTVYNIGNSNLKFNLKNIIKGRYTVIIVRVNALTDNEEIELKYNNHSYKAKITKDFKNRWCNCIFEIPEGEIVEYSPEFTFQKTGTKQFIGSIWVFQKL